MPIAAFPIRNATTFQREMERPNTEAAVSSLRTASRAIPIQDRSILCFNAKAAAKRQIASPCMNLELRRKAEALREENLPAVH
jgi:hypothetical protein